MLRKKDFILIFGCASLLSWLLICPEKLEAQSGSKIKIACIGASITYGAFIENREQNAYPSRLQKLMGENFAVHNYGVNGCTMLKKGNLPYWNTQQYRDALALLPDIVIIDLGGNDSKLVNRKYLDEYEKDYLDMISSFKQLPSHPRVLLMLAYPSFVKDTTGIWDPVIVKQINPLIREVAFKTKCEVLDMHSAFINLQHLIKDDIHPNAEGAGISAKKVFQVLKQQRDKDFDIFTSISNQQNISSFNGYECVSFSFAGRSCKVVKPKLTAKSHPWVWRARFWGHEPQADVALLERGFHIVFCDVAELFGNNEAITAWNEFYRMLTKAGLSKKTVLEGMSRGGIYTLNWAAVNPDKVAAVYIDNPVLDLKSWPGGMGNAMRSPAELELFKKDYQLKNEEDIRNFKGSPIDKVKDIVKGNYPILILCADADEAVPPEENTVLFEKKVKEENGRITVIHKPGFKHHPHSLPNPAPIVDFILEATDKP